MRVFKVVHIVNGEYRSLVAQKALEQRYAMNEVTTSPYGPLFVCTDVDDPSNFYHDNVKFAVLGCEAELVEIDALPLEITNHVPAQIVRNYWLYPEKREEILRQRFVNSLWKICWPSSAYASSVKPIRVIQGVFDARDFLKGY